MKKWIKRITIALIVAAIVFPFVRSTIDATHFPPPPGTLVDIGGYRLHIHSLGTGGPTVIVESGCGGISLDWALVQPQIAKFTRVCSYDRAGVGWSEKSQKPRTCQSFVSELHMLLQKANIPPPYILVGHSLGGLTVRLFANLYPNEVAGVVLVDASCEDITEPLPPALTPSWTERIMMNKMVCSLMTWYGLLRVENTSPILAKLPLEVRNVYCAVSNTASSVCTRFGEAEALDESWQQLQKNGGKIGDIPLIVISAGSVERTIELYTTASQEQKECMRAIWKDHQARQKKLLEKSTHSRQIMAPKSGHLVMMDQPEVIVDAVRELVEQHAHSLE